MAEKVLPESTKRALEKFWLDPEVAERAIRIIAEGSAKPADELVILTPTEAHTLTAIIRIVSMGFLASKGKL